MPSLGHHAEQDVSGFCLSVLTVRRGVYHRTHAQSEDRTLQALVPSLHHVVRAGRGLSDQGPMHSLKPRIPPSVAEKRPWTSIQTEGTDKQ